MNVRIPSEEAIAREMRETGFDRLPALRRIQQRESILREQRRGAR
jgi:hypothetical protein